LSAIENDLFPLSRRMQLLRSMLAKIRPMPESPPDELLDDEPTDL